MIAAVMRQFKKPSGWVGKRLVGPFLNVFHAPLHELYLDTIDVQTENKILEIGFGTGRLLARMAALAKRAVVSGVDYSEDMLQEAQRRNRDLIAQNRMELRLGDLARLDYPDACFDTVCTANTVYYWPDPVNNVREMARVLRPGGKLVVAFRTTAFARFRHAQLGFTWYSVTQVKAILAEAGLVHIESRQRPLIRPPCCVVVARKAVA